MNEMKEMVLFPPSIHSNHAKKALGGTAKPEMYMLSVAEQDEETKMILILKKDESNK